MTEPARLPDLPNDIHARIADKHTLAVALRDGADTRCLGLAYVYERSTGDVHIYLSNSGTHRLLWPTSHDESRVGYSIGSFSEDGWELRGLASKSLANDEQKAKIHDAMAARYPWFDKTMLTGDASIVTTLRWEELALLEVVYLAGASMPVIRISTNRRTDDGVDVHAKEKTPRRS